MRVDRPELRQRAPEPRTLARELRLARAAVVAVLRFREQDVAGVLLFQRLAVDLRAAARLLARSDLQQLINGALQVARQR